VRIGGFKGALFSALIIVPLLVIVLLAPPKAAGFSGSGSTRTAGNPYIITTVEQLQKMENNLTAHYILSNDIDASATISWNSGAGFLPVGTSSTPFTGSFDGQGYKIDNLIINRSGTDYQGLFGYVGTGGVVKNVGLENVNVKGGYAAGGLVGSNEGTVSNSYSTSPVSGGGNVGGLVGSNEGTVSNSYSTSPVSSSLGQVGGLVGYNDGTVSNSYSTSPVVGGSYVGGLVGNDTGGVYNSFWDMQTSGQATSAGGTGKTTESMKNVRTYTDVAWSEGLSSAWDFVGNPYGDAGNGDIWGIDPDVNDGYPFLAAPASPGEGTKAPTRWPLIAGVVGAIVVIDIVAIVYVRRR
jgi:hypothetical protein